MRSYDFIGELPKSIRLYHITRKSRLKSVLSSGLRARYSEEARGNVLYLASSPSNAVMWREFEEESSTYGYPSDMVILSVLVPKGTLLYEDPEAFGEGGSYYVTSNIPAKNIRAIRSISSGRIPDWVMTSKDRLGKQREAYIDKLAEAYSEVSSREVK